MKFESIKKCSFLTFLVTAISANAGPAAPNETWRCEISGNSVVTADILVDAHNDPDKDDLTGPGFQYLGKKLEMGLSFAKRTIDGAYGLYIRYRTPLGEGLLGTDFFETMEVYHAPQDSIIKTNFHPVGGADINMVIIACRKIQQITTCKSSPTLVGDVGTSEKYQATISRIGATRENNFEVKIEDLSSKKMEAVLSGKSEADATLGFGKKSNLNRPGFNESFTKKGALATWTKTREFGNSKSVQFQCN